MTLFEHALTWREAMGERYERSPLGMVYLMWAEGTDFYKIGFTRHSPSKRLEQVRTNCPFRVQLVGTTPARMMDEQNLHFYLSGCRLNGEWFVVREEIRRALCEWVDARGWEPNGRVS